MIKFNLADFIIESNYIEGITTTSKLEIIAYKEFLLGPINVVSVEKLVSVIQPGAKLREKAGMNVQVGSHIPPKGGPNIKLPLETLLRVANLPTITPLENHF